jgi:hypothetical protein
MRVLQDAVYLGTGFMTDEEIRALANELDQRADNRMKGMAWLLIILPIVWTVLMGALWFIFGAALIGIVRGAT